MEEFDRQPIGHILLKRGLINEKQLEEALALQKKQKGLVGEILIQLGYIEEIDVVVALIMQCGIPYIAVNKYNLDKEVLKLIPEKIAREFLLIPLDRVGQVLSVVMADPLNDTIKQKIEEITQCQVAPFVATKTEIIKAIERSYKKK